MGWPDLVKKYVWDEEKTPYLVRPERLTPRQARSELFAYAVLLAVFAGVIAVVAGAGHARAGVLGPATALYALTVFVGAIVLGVSGHPAAAAYCMTAPAALLLAAVFGAVRPGMARGEMVVVAALSALWLGYAARVVRVARRLRGLV